MKTPRKCSLKSSSAEQPDSKKKKQIKKEVIPRKKKALTSDVKPKVFECANLSFPDEDIVVTNKHVSVSKPAPVGARISSPTRPIAAPKLNLLSPVQQDAPSTVTASVCSSIRLEAFGIKSGRSSSTLTTKLASNIKGSNLRCVFITGGGLQKAAIVFKFEPKDPFNKSGSWAEKCMHDALRDQLDWVVQLDFEPNPLHWYENNIEMKNPKNFNIRLFVILADQLPTKENAVALGKHICSNLERGSNHPTTVDPRSFFWIEENVVWSDIIGYDAALQSLYNLTGEPYQGKYVYLLFFFFVFVKGC